MSLNVVYLEKHQLVPLIKNAYNLSKPQGMGFMHYQEGELSDEVAESLINFDDNKVVISIDYLYGRAVKLSVFKDKEGKFFIKNDRWFDHTESDLNKLVESIDNV